MFGFWKKKGGEIPEEQQWQRSAEQRAKERQEAAEIPQALRTLGQDFLPEELEVLAVTGANPFSGSQGEEGEGLWPAFIGLTAWMEEDSMMVALLLCFFRQFSRSDAKPKLPFMKSSGFSGRFTPARLNTKSAFWQYLSNCSAVESRSYS